MIKKLLKKDPFKFEKGYLHVPDDPGLGIEIDEESVEKFSLD